MNEFNKIREAIIKYVGSNARKGFDIAYLEKQKENDPKAKRLLDIYYEATDIMYEMDSYLNDKKMFELKEEAESLVN